VNNIKFKKNVPKQYEEEKRKLSRDDKSYQKNLEKERCGSCSASLFLSYLQECNQISDF